MAPGKGPRNAKRSPRTHSQGLGLLGGIFWKSSSRFHKGGFVSVPVDAWKGFGTSCSITNLFEEGINTSSSCWQGRSTFLLLWALCDGSGTIPALILPEFLPERSGFAQGQASIPSHQGHPSCAQGGLGKTWKNHPGIDQSVPDPKGEPEVTKIREKGAKERFLHGYEHPWT